MRAGALFSLVYFEQLVSQLDSDGDLVESWVDAFPVSTRMPCQTTPLSGRELLAAQSMQSKVTHRLVTRYRPGFVANMRGRDGVLTYNIEAVVPDPNSGIEYVTLLCSSGVNQGGSA